VYSVYRYCAMMARTAVVLLVLSCCLVTALAAETRSTGRVGQRSTVRHLQRSLRAHAAQRNPNQPQDLSDAAIFGHRRRAVIRVPVRRLVAVRQPLQASCSFGCQQCVRGCASTRTHCTRACFASQAINVNTYCGASCDNTFVGCSKGCQALS